MGCTFQPARFLGLNRDLTALEFRLPPARNSSRQAKILAAFTLCRKTQVSKSAAPQELEHHRALRLADHRPVPTLPPHAICEDDGIIGECSTEAEQEDDDVDISWAAY